MYKLKISGVECEIKDIKQFAIERSYELMQPIKIDTDEQAIVYLQKSGTEILDK